VKRRRPTAKPCRRRCCLELRRRAEKLERENADLRRLLDEAQRAGKRQAAPFSKGAAKKAPKKPGRKSGAAYGKRAFRVRPKKIDRVIEAPVGVQKCPDCGGKLGKARIERQFVTDIPQVEPTVTQFNVHICECLNCGKRIQGRHPEQISDAMGAAANQIGPNAIAFTMQLNKSTGASYGKISRFFNDAFDLSVGRSTLLRALLRTARKAEPLYQGIAEIVRDSDACYPDETGWKVGGRLQWLWGFPCPKEKATLYVIEPSRGFDVIDSVLGTGYDGFLGRDGWAPYDRLVSATHQLCLRHIIVRCDRLDALNTGGAVRFPRHLKALLQSALLLRNGRDGGTLTRRQFLGRTRTLEWDLDELITRRFSNDENRKLAGHIINHREKIFTFLYHPEVEATNFHGEQSMRPAVVNRKMSGGGNRTSRGARAQAVLTSTLRTADQRHLPVIPLVVDLLRSPSPEQFAALVLGP
jgi:transposase